MHRTSCLALAFLSSASLALAAGEVWRTPEPFPPATGPSEIQVSGEAVPEVSKLSKRQRRKLAAAPLVLVDVRDEAGRPVAGASVRVSARIGKGNAGWDGATAADGRFVFRPTELVGLKRLDVDVGWDGGTKKIGVDLEPKDEGWKIDESKYRNAGSGAWEGDCRNLFNLEQDAGRLFLSVTRPASLLSCRGVEYGIDRKSSAMARLHDIGRRDVNEGDTNYFSPGDEAKMGVEAANHFDKQFEQVRDPVITGYVESLVRKVVRHSDMPDMPVSLRVVHTEGINAFVTAGGHVYVFTGLIAAAENEAQLAGVLAHEVSHVVARHVTEGASRQMKTQAFALIAGIGIAAAADMDRKETEDLVTGAMIGAGLYGMKHGRAAETEADLLGAQYLWKAGWDPESIAHFFAVLDRESGPSPPGWLSTHPPHERRIDNGLHWARAFLPERERHLVNTREFEEVKRRVKALPPPRKRPPAETEAAGLSALYAGTAVFQDVALRQWGDLLRR